MTQKNIVIIGASSLGREAIAIAGAAGHCSVVGVLDDRSPSSRDFEGVPYLGDIESIKKVSAEEADIAVVIAIGDSQVRRDVYRRIAQVAAAVKMATLIHPRATVMGKAVIECGCIIFPGVTIGAGARIGRAGVLNAGATIGGGSTIGEFVSVGPGANVGSDVVLGAGAYLGMGAVIGQGVRVGEYCTVGALSFVREDTTAGSLVVGIPGRTVRRQR